MYVGLSMTYASSFQMFRGAVIVFVAILSIVFLGRRQVLRQWLGIVIICAGLGKLFILFYFEIPVITKKGIYLLSLF